MKKTKVHEGLFFMFEKWNFPANMCGLYTISRENLSFYVDRKDVSKDVQKSIQIGANCSLLIK